MSELVLLHHNEPMTTSLAIANGTENSHESVIKLVRKYVEDLQSFGTLGFEIQKSGGLPTEFAYLNEPQATLLITYMRNSDIVRRFKIALVKAFYELRDQAAVSPAPTFRLSDAETVYPGHEASKIVNSDKIFRAVLRAGKSTGMPASAAYEVARKVAHGISGVDLVGYIKEIDEQMRPKLKPSEEGAAKFFALAEAGEIDMVDFSRDDNEWIRECYRDWCKENHYLVGSLEWHFKNIRYRQWKAEKEAKAQAATLEATGERFPA